MFDIKGKVALVTGVSSGLGEDAAKAYAAQGCKVCLLARRKDKLGAIAEDPMSRPGLPGELNGTILYFSNDTSSYVTGQYIIVDGGFALV